MLELPNFVRGGTLSRSILRAVGALVALSVPCVGYAGDPFQVVELLDTELVRGQSTKEDVRRLIGKPDQKGEARLPPSGTQQVVWYYEEQKIHSSRLNPEIRDGQLRADAEERALFIFFTDNFFDGYLWYGIRLEGEDLP